MAAYCGQLWKRLPIFQRRPTIANIWKLHISEDNVEDRGRTLQIYSFNRVRIDETGWV